MAANKLLLPIDLAKCPLEIFPMAKGFAKPHGGEIELLYVLELRSKAGKGGASEADRQRAERHLERIGRDYLWPSVKACCRVRAGIPHEEIFAEAAAARADLILLPVRSPSVWRRFVGSGHGETARRLVAGASCGVFVIDVRMCFNCFRDWQEEGSPTRWGP
jgi:nucleotide-binding universal stress UspA family protein